MKYGAASSIAVLCFMLLAAVASLVSAHHNDDHTQGPNGGGGGGNSGGGGNDTRESVNSGVLSGNMLLFTAAADVSVSNKSKPPIDVTDLVVKSSKNAETRAYLRFTVTGVSGPVTAAKILLRSSTNSGFGGDMRLVSDVTWPETWFADDMTWSNQPAVDLSQDPLSFVDRIVGDIYYEWDVSSVVTGNDIYSFVMTCDSCSSTYDSSEAAMVPYLVVVEEGGSEVAAGVSTDPVLVGAGDIANCGSGDPSLSGAEKTAQLLDDVVAAASEAALFTAGDAAYTDGTLSEFQNCYDPTWGRHFDWTNPSPGNHEYNTPGAAGYYAYFGVRAGDPAKGYYSYDIGDYWHVVALNSNCTQIGGCDIGSLQNDWLRTDLANSSAPCTVAYLHHPPHSSGEHSSEADLQPLMEALHDFDAEVLIAGHDHNYERFAPQDADGVTDLAGGIRLFVVGSGGTGLRAFRTPIANSEARFNSLNGILKLTLHSASYDWQFLPVAVTDPDPVEEFSDQGSALCH